MGRTISVFLESLGFYDPNIAGLPMHGANLITSQMLRRFAADERVDAIEVFVPPAVMLDENTLAKSARAALPASRRGRGVLRFYPFHSLPEVWADGEPRILFTLDPDRLTRDRYLRDRYAIGPTPITCDTHTLGHHRLWSQLVRLAGTPPVAYDSIACISEACLEAHKRALSGFLAPVDTPLPCRLDLMHHGVDTDIYAQQTEQSKIDSRRILRWPQDAQITLFLGRLTPNAKADLMPLLRVFQKVALETDYLVIAGMEETPGYVEKLREVADELGLGDRLIIRTDVTPGYQQLFYTAADIFVFPGDTIQETLGNTVMEAMATGLPVIISDWDGMRDLVVEGATGYKVPCYWMPNNSRLEAFSMTCAVNTEYLYVAQSVWVDTGILADRLRAMLRSPELRRRMGAAGRERVVRHFAFPLIIDRWHALWNELQAIAETESVQQKAVRREYAARIGLPTPYMELFDHYATGVFDPDEHSFRLSEVGRAVLSRQQVPRFYDETLPLLHDDIINSLFDVLANAGTRWSKMRSITDAVAAETGRHDDDVRYHLGLLLKRDLLECSTSRT